MSDEDVRSLFTYHFTPLLYRCQHGIAGDGTVAVGESADGDVVRHLETHALGGIEDTYCRVIVDGKESIGGGWDFGESQG